MAMVFAMMGTAPAGATSPSEPGANPGANGRILYVNVDVPSAQGTMMTNPDGTGKALFTYKGLPTGEIYPEAWAPAGLRFLATSPAGGNLYDLWVIPASGKPARDLTNQYGDETGGASWSPDATHVAYAMNPRGSTHDIWIINADGTGTHDVTNAAGEDLYPTWSADGSRIVFASDRTGHWQIYSMKTDGSGLANLSNSGANDFFPTWSPDNARIAFQSDRNGNDEIYVMNADGSNPVRLTNNAAADTGPSWSPDGTRIVFTSDRNGNQNVFGVNTDGTGLSQMTTDPANEVVVQGGWQPIPSANTTVTVSDSGFSPTKEMAKQGWLVGWEFTGTMSHAVKDTAGLGLFGSGSEPPGGAYAAWFFGAGTFSVLDPTTVSTAKVVVAPTAKPSSGPAGTTFTVKWSSASPPGGFTFDVQMRTPGARSWTTIESNTTDTSLTTSPSNPGTYQFRVRLRNGKAKSGWSPVAKFKVT